MTHSQNVVSNPCDLGSPSLEILVPKEEILIMTVLLDTGLCLTPGHFISHDTQSDIQKEFPVWVTVIDAH